MNSMDLKPVTHRPTRHIVDGPGQPTDCDLLLALAGPTPGDAQPYSGGRYNDDRRDDDRFDDEQNHRRVVTAPPSAVNPMVITDTAAPTPDGVQLSRQLSKSACRYNDTWGYDRRGIWVDRGCRGDFQLYTGSSGGDGKQKDKDNTAAIVGGAIALGILRRCCGARQTGWP